MDDPMIAKTPPSLSSRRRRAAPRRGVALLLVLGCLVLLVALIVGLLVSAQNNLKSSKLYANGSSVKALADSTVSLVMAQIQQATSNGTTVAWASQPGMIRTYSNAGQPLTNYRLFSWDSPTVSGTYTPSTDVSQLSTWSSTPGIFVDLNQPVADTSGTLHYPILDGNPADLTSYTLTATLPSQPASVLTYTNNGVTPAIEGFYVTPGVAATTTQNSVPMPVKWLYVLRDGSVVAPAAGTTGSTITIAGASQSNPIVGRIAYWTDDETSKININTASEGNYWDTPRANGVVDFNFASYQPVQNEFQRYPGHPATTCLSSVFNSVSTASLTLVNHALQAASVAALTHTGGTASATLYAPYQFYYDLAPKLNLNNTGNTPDNLGSMAGSRSYTTTTSTAALTPKTDRLYASPDELLFQSGLTSDSSHSSVTVGATTGSSKARAITTNATPITPAFLEKAKFFITASSRAPDVNLFNQPRIVCWPVPAANQSFLDKMIALCGTVGTNTYYFIRSNNSSPVFDLDDTTTPMTRNRSLLNYLYKLEQLPVPGFGSGPTSTFSAKYPTVGGVSEMSQINTEIFDYIRCLNLNDPQSTGPYASTATGSGKDGFGNTDSNTASSGSGQVVPIYDKNTSTRGFGRMPTLQEASIVFVATGWNDGNGGATTDINYWGKSTTNTFTAPAAVKGTFAPLGYYANGSGTGSYTTASTYSTTTKYTAQPSGTLSPFPTIPDQSIQVQAILVLSFFDPSQGNMAEHPTIAVQAIGLNSASASASPSNAFQWGPSSGSLTSMGFPYGYPNDCTNAWGVVGNGAGDEYKVLWGGNMGFRTFMTGCGPGHIAPVPNSTASTSYYPFISAPQTFPYNPATPSNPGTFYFSGGQVTFALLLPDASWPTSATPSGWPTNGEPVASRAPIQQITVSFPSGNFPLPTYTGWTGTSGYGGGNNNLAEERGSLVSRMECGSNAAGPNPEFTWEGTNSNAGGNLGGDTVRSVRACPGDMRMIAGRVSVTDSSASPASAPGYYDYAESKISASGLSSWLYDVTGNSTPVTYRMVHSLRESLDFPFYGATLGALVPGAGGTGILGYVQQPALGSTMTQNNYQFGLFYVSGAGGCALATGAVMNSGVPGDFDNGLAYTADGPFINKADEGLVPNTGGSGTSLPYFINSNDGGGQSVGVTYFSPNRLMPGPGMFGSLSTGVIRNQPWMTLLFCPNPAAGAGHPGFGTDVNGNQANAATLPPYTYPPDHLLLDLFNMPVVEPYPISEPLSTAGRINMNYQIVPFTYIERSTGLRAVLKSDLMTVIPDGAAGSYKAQEATGINSSPDATTNWNFRYPIDPDQTLLGFDYYFSNNNDIFRSASQICQMFLYPTEEATSSTPLGTTTGVPKWDSANANIMKFWNGNTSATAPSSFSNVSKTASHYTHFLTGDNSRERPYTTIYPRLTTKSNTFTIHYYVQTLKQAETANSPASAWGTWREGTDLVTGEYRGASLIERYVDPNDPSLSTVDFTASGAPALDSWYKFRVISNTQFAP